MSMKLEGPKNIPIADINTTFFVRLALNEGQVEMLKDMYEHGTPIKPITVNQDMELIAGRHRIEALRRLGRDKVIAFIATTESTAECIIEAIKDNCGGALPPSQGDIEHAIELLMVQGLTKREILESLPFKPNQLDKYYRLVKNRIYKRRVGVAVNAVITQNITMEQAAERFHVKLEELQQVLLDRKEQGTTLKSILASLETRSRALGQSLGSTSREITEQYKNGEITPEDVERFADRVRDSTRNLARNGEQIRNRMRALLLAVESSDEDEAPANPGATTVIRRLEARV